MGRFYGPRAHRLKYALPQSTPPPRMASAFGTEMVLDVRHWTDDYFSFTTTRDDGFRFDNGQFVMIGLEVDGRPLLRSEEHTSELQSLMRISYAVFCLKKKNKSI